MVYIISNPRRPRQIRRIVRRSAAVKIRCPSTGPFSPAVLSPPSRTAASASPGRAVAPRPPPGGRAVLGEPLRHLVGRGLRPRRKKIIDRTASHRICTHCYRQHTTLATVHKNNPYHPPRRIRQAPILPTPQTPRHSQRSACRLPHGSSAPARGGYASLLVFTSPMASPPT